MPISVNLSYKPRKISFPVSGWKCIPWRLCRQERESFVYREFGNDNSAARERSIPELPSQQQNLKIVKVIKSASLRSSTVNWRSQSGYLSQGHSDFERIAAVPTKISLQLFIDVYRCSLIRN
ncbi:hypothetical protein [uncultured Nostoc sp.]|uniref:hypothetical protein n=1 Tax=uncultured Nostoc sp. TaxID=340711 RepID=UPI00262E8CEF|nr:hypothetical protein [uncultured Nostoc sp.]